MSHGSSFRRKKDKLKETNSFVGLRETMKLSLQRIFTSAENSEGGCSSVASLVTCAGTDDQSLSPEPSDHKS